MTTSRFPALTERGNLPVANFYVDFDAPVHDPAAQEALQAVAELTSFLRVLGSYPKAR